MNRGLPKIIYVSWIVGGTVGVAIYFARRYITPIIDSYDLCNIDDLVESTKWFFPKIASRCAEILTLELEQFPGLDVVIVVDVWAAGLGVFLLIYSHKKIWNCNLEALEKTREKMKGSRTKMWFAAIFYIFLSCLLLSMLFISSPLLPDSGTQTDFLALISPIPGHGFFILSIVPGMVVGPIACSVIYIRGVTINRPRPNVRETPVGAFADEARKEISKSD